MSEFYLPERMGHIILQGMEEILGGDGLGSVLQAARISCPEEQQAFPFPFFGQLSEALEKVHGTLAGRGLSLRAGRACFSYALRAYADGSPMADPLFRVMPFPAKLNAAGLALANLFNQETDQRVHVEESEGRMLWKIERCPFCWQRHTTEAACHLAIGFAEESLYWLSGGKIFEVEEVACVARGDLACTMQIDLVPFS